MLRRIFIILVAVLTVGVIGLAQDLAPTTGDGPDAIAKNTTENSATVSQTVQLILPNATALHLDVTTVPFDLTSLDGAAWPNSTVDFGDQMVCVYGKADTDTVQPQGPTYFSQVQYLPLGTQYVESELGYPYVAIDGGSAVTAYPPIQIDANGELVAGSKGYFVCYRSFLLQKFSNGAAWDLTVSRTDAADNKMAIQRLYIQDNPCATFGAPTGLFKLDQGDTLHLVPTDLAIGPTGVQAASNPDLCGYKSWLDDLVVMAVVVDDEYSGINTAELDYTLTTTAWDP